ncbi:MAG: carboxypeptidase-like regulatory domain-containing protein [Gammaproteobacteria bacterium]|nr:carboxypeptidase-like regulatory domain-containing protein [Gammaproteobacteria bacterium]
MRSEIRRLLLLAVGAFFLAGCDGDDGAAGAAGAAGMDGMDGQNAVDKGTISATVTSGGNPVEGATVSTNPASSTADTDASGVASLTDVNIGVYEVIATIGGITSSESNVGVAAGSTTDVALSLSGVPGTVTGKVLGPGVDPQPVVGATVSAPGSADAVTDADGVFMIDAVVSEFLSVTPPAGSTLLKGGTRASVAAGDVVDIALSGGPEADATFVGSEICLVCHEGGLTEAWMDSGHYRVVERSLEEMDLNGWPADPGAGLCSAWFDTGVIANIPGEPSTKGEETHGAYIRTCNDDPDQRYEVLFDSDTDGVANELVDLVVPVYATYGGPGTAAGEIAELQARGLATTINGAWKQRYMVSIADLGACSPTNPEGTFDKNPKPAWVGWDTTQTCEDMLMLPVQFNQRSLEWVSYHPWEWYEQKRAYSKKCSGCHEAGVKLTADAAGLVTEYSAVDYRIGCEKCHGPGSSHVSGGGDPNAIMNPDHMSVVDSVNVCGQCHSRGSDPIDGAFGFPWRSDVADLDGNFVAGLHTLDWDAVEATEGYFLQKPGNWPTGFPKSHRQQYNSYLGSSHLDNPYLELACNDCHSPHSGKGGPFRFTNEDFEGNEFEFGGNSNALMSNVRCLSCHAGFGPWSTLSKDDIAVYHVSRGGSVDKNGVALAPDAAEQTSAEDLVQQAVKVHSGESAGMPLAPYLPENSHIPANYLLGEGPVGRCTSCHMTKTAKSGTWFVDEDGLTAAGDNTDHSFQVVTIEAGTDQPNACGSCHASFRTKFEEPGGD